MNRGIGRLRRHWSARGEMAVHRVGYLLDRMGLKQAASWYTRRSWPLVEWFASHQRRFVLRHLVGGMGAEPPCSGVMSGGPSSRGAGVDVSSSRGALPLDEPTKHPGVSTPPRPLAGHCGSSGAAAPARPRDGISSIEEATR